MMGTHVGDTDPYKIDPLEYLSSLNGNLSPVQQREHYEVLSPERRDYAASWAGGGAPNLASNLVLV